MVRRTALYAAALLVLVVITGVVVARQAAPGSEALKMATAQVAIWERSEIVNLGPVVNSKFRETGLSVSGDGRTLLFVSDRPGGVGGRDIWMTTRKGSTWTRPVNLGAPVNSPANDGGLSLSADGKTLFFTSNRAGGLGGEDLYMTRFVNGRWTKPVNLGEAINSSSNESMVSITKNNRELYFHSDRPGGQGGTDVHVSTFRDGVWRRAVNLGAQVNSPGNERNPSVSNDGLTMLFATGRTRFGPNADERMMIATRTTVAGQWTKPIPFGPRINVQGAYQSCQEVTNDGKTMFFISNRPGSIGQDDVWMAQSP